MMLQVDDTLGIAPRLIDRAKRGEGVRLTYQRHSANAYGLPNVSFDSLTSD